MKLPSISQAGADARDTFVRFPFIILDAVVGTVCALVMIDHTGPFGPSVLIRIIFGAVLGFPLLTGLEIASQKWRLSPPISLAALDNLFGVNIPEKRYGE